MGCVVDLSHFHQTSGLPDYLGVILPLCHLEGSESHLILQKPKMTRLQLACPFVALVGHVTWVKPVGCSGCSE